MNLSTNKPKGLTGRYITALLQLCSSEKVLKKVVNDLSEFNNIVENNKDLEILLTTPTISKNKKKNSIIEILKKAKANYLVINFFGVIIQNNRTNILKKIIKDFLLEVSRIKGELIVEVFSSHKLSSKEEQHIKEIMSKKIVGKNISLLTQEDNSLIGGMVLKIGSKMIDGSIKNKLKNLEIKMKGDR